MNNGGKIVVLGGVVIVVYVGALLLYPYTLMPVWVLIGGVLSLFGYAAHLKNKEGGSR